MKIMIFSTALADNSEVIALITKLKLLRINNRIHQQCQINFLAYVVKNLNFAP